MKMNNKKKFIAPIVVLMLCAVAMIGIAYAASSTLTQTGIGSEVVKVSLDNDGTNKKFTTEGKFEYQTVTTVVNGTGVKDTKYKWEEQTLTYAGVTLKMAGKDDVTYTIAGVVSDKTGILANAGITVNIVNNTLQNGESTAVTITVTIGAQGSPVSEEPQNGSFTVTFTATQA